MKARFEKRKIFGRGLEPSLVVAESKDWEVTLRNDYDDKGNLIGRIYVVQIHGRDDARVFHNENEAILHAIGATQNDDSFGEYAYLMLRGLEDRREKLGY